MLGVGVGTHPGEYAAAGVDFGSRGRASRRGDRRPAPVPGIRPPGAPLRAAARPRAVPDLGRGSSEAALRRAARRGDGWIPLFVPPADYARGAGSPRQGSRAGRARSRRAIARATVVFVSVGGAGAGERGLSWMASLYALPGAILRPAPRRPGRPARAPRPSPDSPRPGHSTSRSSSPPTTRWYSSRTWPASSPASRAPRADAAAVDGLGRPGRHGETPVRSGEVCRPWRSSSRPGLEVRSS